MNTFFERSSWARRNGGIAQLDSEFLKAFNTIAKAPPAVFVEVGTYRGGSLYTYAGVCQPGATIITVDIECQEPMRRVIDRLTEEGYHVCFVQGDSSSPETLAQVKSIIGAREVDLLHIDGDHSEDGVRKDWDAYHPLVRQGGMVMFHDISERHKDAQVSPVWKRVREGRKFEEYEEKSRTIGIGVLWI